jgi:hypothetical protein
VPWLPGSAIGPVTGRPSIQTRQTPEEPADSSTATFSGRPAATFVSSSPYVGIPDPGCMTS